jgi:hypothetical protein
MTETTTSATVVQLAREIVRTHDLSACPILADALQEEGLGEAGDLNELRAEQVFGRKPCAEEVGRLLIDLLGVAVVVDDAEDNRTGRLRARTVNADSCARRVAARALVSGRAYYCTHGGSVANAYGYAAATEGVLAAAVYDAGSNVVRVKVYGGELAANKVTAAGVAGLFGFRDLCDGRASGARQRAALEALYAAVVGG